MLLGKVQDLAFAVGISRLNHGGGLNDPLRSDMTGRPRTRGCRCGPKHTPESQFNHYLAKNPNPLHEVNLKDLDWKPLRLTLYRSTES